MRRDGLEKQQLFAAVQDEWLKNATAGGDTGALKILPGRAVVAPVPLQQLHQIMRRAVTNHCVCRSYATRGTAHG